MDRTTSSPFADFMRNNDPGKIGDGISDGDGNGSLIDSSSSEHHDNYLAGAAATPTPTANASSISNAKLPDYYRQDASVVYIRTMFPIWHISLYVRYSFSMCLVQQNDTSSEYLILVICTIFRSRTIIVPYE